MSAGQERRRQGFWLTAGEMVGVLALVIAGLNLWESHQQRVEESRRAQTSQQAGVAFVATGLADQDGRRLVLSPLKPTQAIQSQRFRFPADLQDGGKEVSAARPHIDLDWISPGLRSALQAAHVKGAGEGHLPVVIDTTYVEDGETRTDRSLYRIGYAWKPRFLGGEQLRLEGLALIRRGLADDGAKAVELRWAAERPKPPG
jgi:hypothetical protein